MAIIRIFETAEGEAGPSSPARSLTARPAFSLLNTLLAGGEAIPHDCGGKAQCGTCRVRVLAGGERLSRPRENELLRLGAVGAGGNERLACQTYATREVDLEIVGRSASPRAGRDEGQGPGTDSTKEKP
jgi:ferredoxin